MTTGERLRLFVAIAPPAAMRSALGAAIDELRQVAHGPMRWVPLASIHLTLKFLGDVDPSRVDELAESLGDACAGVAPFELWPVGGGTFPVGKRFSAVWARVTSIWSAASAICARIVTRSGSTSANPNDTAA